MLKPADLLRCEVIPFCQRRGNRRPYPAIHWVYRHYSRKILYPSLLLRRDLAPHCLCCSVSSVTMKFEGFESLVAIAWPKYLYTGLYKIRKYREKGSNWKLMQKLEKLNSFLLSFRSVNFLVKYLSFFSSPSLPLLPVNLDLFWNFCRVPVTKSLCILILIQHSLQ